MMSSDDLLKEDTSHIRNSKKEEFKLSYNKQLLITIIVGIFVVYIGGYTLYNVYLVPNNERVGVVLDDTTLIDVAYEIIDKVPYQMNTSLVYDDYGLTTITDLTEEFIVSYIIESLESDEYMSLTTCSSGYDCIEVTTSTISSKILDYYNETISMPSEVVLSDSSVCTLSNLLYSCELKENDTYTGKISVIELVKEDEDYFYVYETALFATNTYINTDTIYISSLSTKTTSAGNIIANASYKVESTSMFDEIMNLYYDQALIYLHTFSKENGNYYWQSTSVVSSIPS